MASVLDLIGETPLLELTQFDRGPCQLFLKLESANPSGSIKDRPARAMPNRPSKIVRFLVMISSRSRTKYRSALVRIAVSRD